MSSSFLSLIKKTCNFDRKRFGQDIDRFQSTNQTNNQTNEPAIKLTKSQKRRLKLKRKAAEVAEQEEQNEDEDDDQVMHDHTNESSDDAADEDDQHIESQDEEPESNINLFANQSAKQSNKPSNKQSANPLKEAARLKREFLRDHAIHVQGSDVPDPIKSFAEITMGVNESNNQSDNQPVPPFLLQNLTAPFPTGLGFTTPTAVQMMGVPIILADREAVIAAPTGEGKTIAFLLPIIMEMWYQSINQSNEQSTNGTRAVILSPTHELATQTASVARKLLRGFTSHQSIKQSVTVTLLNTANLNDQSFLGSHADKRSIVVATPGMMLKLLKLSLDQSNNQSNNHSEEEDDSTSPDQPVKQSNAESEDENSDEDNDEEADESSQQRAINLSNFRHLILDEADRLMDALFFSQLDECLSLIDKMIARSSFRMHLFSATIARSLDVLIDSLIDNPVKCTISARNTAQHRVEQKLVFTLNERGKLMALESMMRTGLASPMLMFVQSSARAQQLYAALQTMKSSVSAGNIGVVHGELSQAARATMLDMFRFGDLSILITTDLLSRGLDFAPIATVINIDLPTSTADYIHRIGRTGRAGRQGLSITFFTEHDKPMLSYLAPIMQHCGADLPEWIKQLKKAAPSQVEKLKKFAPPREPLMQIGEKKEKKVGGLKPTKKKQTNKQAPGSLLLLKKPSVNDESDDQITSIDQSSNQSKSKSKKQGKVQFEISMDENEPANPTPMKLQNKPAFHSSKSPRAFKPSSSQKSNKRQRT